MENKPIGKNAVLNTIKTLLTIIFPVISYPYAMRKIGLTGMGRYQFAASIISYFTLIAGLGIPLYAVREGTKVRDDRKRFDEFASNIFSINLYSTGFSYILLVVVCIFSRKLANYQWIIALLSVEVVLSTFSMNWVYTVVEDYFFTTLASVILQVLSFLGIFLFIHSEKDLLIYAGLTMLSNYGYALFTFLYSRKYVSVHFVPKPAIRHLRPVMFLFFSAVASTIYISSDTTILGWLTNDERVGIYSAASKIYYILKSIINAMIAVTIPRVTYYIAHDNRSEAKQLSENVLNVLILICFPAITGLIFLSKEIVVLYGGQSCYDAYKPLIILSIALFFAVFANFFANCILIALNKEKTIMVAMMVSALLNIVFNFIFIPVYQENAAAFTTLCAEIVVFLIALLSSRKRFPVQISRRNIIQCVIGCVGVVVICMAVRYFILNKFLQLVMQTGFSVIGYFAIQLALRNTVLTKDLVKMFRR